MRNHLLFYVSAILLLSACSADKTIERGNGCCASLSRIDSYAITISEDGYLVFPTSQILKDYMENFRNGDTKAFYSSNASSLKGFESVADLGERLECLKTCANDTKNYTENISDLEEMTREEYNLMKAENMLFDDALTHIVDTTLRICVEGRLYKITELGTFSVDANKSEFLEEAIRSFNLEIKRAIKSGGSILLDNNVLFTNSFADQNIHYSDLQIEETTNAIGAASGNSTINELHKDYNVLSYHWKSNSLFQKFLNSLRGKDVSRGNKFSKNRRVQVNVFDVNYAFYASAGIKVKMQKRKKFLGIPYWKDEKAEKIVIGFNRLDGVMKYKNPRSLSSIIPSPNRKWNSFVANINGIQSKFIYGIYHKLPFIKDWTDNILCMMPKFQVGNNNWRETVGSKLYNLPAETVYKKLKYLENKHIYSKILKKITPKTPKMAYFVWGESSQEFNKERPYITGIEEYKNCKSKSVIFDRSFGLSFNNMSVTGFLPSEFDIKKIDVFGAAYYDGEWRGVRFYKY